MNKEQLKYWAIELEQPRGGNFQSVEKFVR
jgi:hypothetical protein